MAKKEGKKKISKEQESSDTISSVKTAVKEVISSNVIGHVKSYMKDLAHQAQDIAYQTERKVLENLFAATGILIGGVFIVLAVVFFINDFFMLDRHWGFLIVGLALVAVSLIYKRKIEKTKYYNFRR